MGDTAKYITTLFTLPFELTDPKKALKDAIIKHEETILDLNRQQLDRGKDAKGDSLGKYKNFKYKGRWQPVDLKLTGDFRDKFSLEVDDKQTTIFSQDKKDDLLKKKYGKDIFGVADPFIPNVTNAIEDDFVKNYQKQLIKS